MSTTIRCWQVIQANDIGTNLCIRSFVGHTWQMTSTAQSRNVTDAQKMEYTGIDSTI